MPINEKFPKVSPKIKNKNEKLKWKIEIKI